jgi:LmbE family N-acetylglucosaminyl deacetylase
VNEAHRLLVVVAHPDDESFGCGSILARATELGVEATVVCSTRGEAGECDPSTGVDPSDLAAVRERELRTAAGILGVDRVILLDHRDSNMSGEPAAGALVAIDQDDLAAELREIIDDVRPDVVVTLDGSDGHRDHVAIRDATLRAVRTAAPRPSRTYLSCLLRSAMDRWVDHLREVDRWGDYTALADLGTPDEEITTVIDVRHLLDLRWAAIRAHASQVSPFAALPTDLADLFLARDHLVRVEPPWTGGPVETDIFATTTLASRSAR